MLLVPTPSDYNTALLNTMLKHISGIQVKVFGDKNGIGKGSQNIVHMGDHYMRVMGLSKYQFLKTLSMTWRCQKDTKKTEL